MRSLSAALLIVFGVGCTDREGPTGPDLSPGDAAPGCDAEAAYHNPIDGKTYAVPGGWRTYHPEEPKPVPPGQKVKKEQVRLLTSASEAAARTTAEEMGDFINEAGRLAEREFGESGRRFRVLAQFDCGPDGCEVSLAHEGDATPEELQRYYDALKAAKPPQVTGGTVAFQLELSVSP